MKKNITLITIGGYIAVAIVLLLLPSNFFDTGQSICLSIIIADQECPGCGITRAIQHLIHFEFKAAWNFNKLSFIVFPVLAFLYSLNLVRLYKKLKNKAS